MSVVQCEQGDQPEDTWIKTPNMDRLAARRCSLSERFRNGVALLAKPCGIPDGPVYALERSRQQPYAFPHKQRDHATILRAAGYKTGYIGKWRIGRSKRPATRI